MDFCRICIWRILIQAISSWQYAHYQPTYPILSTKLNIIKLNVSFLFEDSTLLGGGRAGLEEIKSHIIKKLIYFGRL